MKKWRETLFAIEAGLCDAEEKQLKSRAVKLWLDDLKDLAYDVEDILDKFDSEMLRCKVNEPNQTGASKVRGLFPKVKLHFNMKQEIEDITDRCRIHSFRFLSYIIFDFSEYRPILCRLFVWPFGPPCNHKKSRHSILVNSIAFDIHRLQCFHFDSLIPHDKS